jgi:hypothetical protein
MRTVEGRPEGSSHSEISLRTSDKYIRGRRYYGHSVEEGILIGNQTYVRYVGMADRLLNLEFWRVNGNRSCERLAVLHIRMFLGYECTGLPDGARCLIRVSKRCRGKKGTTLRFAFDTESPIQKASKLGIQPPVIP